MLFEAKTEKETAVEGYPDEKDERRQDYECQDEADDDQDSLPSGSLLFNGVVIIRRHGLVKHGDSAAPTSCEVPIRGRGAAAAPPAELVLAQVASHVVAALVFLNARPAERTE